MTNTLLNRESTDAKDAKPPCIQLKMSVACHVFYGGEARLALMI